VIPSSFLQSSAPAFEQGNMIEGASNTSNQNITTVQEFNSPRELEVKMRQREAAFQQLDCCVCLNRKTKKKILQVATPLKRCVKYKYVCKEATIFLVQSVRLATVGKSNKLNRLRTRTD
jgi:hypothetical protein